MRDIFQQRTVLSTDFISVSDFTQALQQVATDRTAAITLAIEASSQNQAQQTAADISNAIALSQDLLRGEYSNKIDWNSFGAPYGVAPLDGNGLVPPGNLPAFSTDSVGEGFNLFFTNERAALAAPVQSVAGRIGDVVLSVSDITGAVAVSSVGAADGIATLDSNGKLSTAQIPASLIGALTYQGVWNASTNTPALTSSVGEKGQYFKVSVAGATDIDGTSQWEIGDIVVFNGTVWDRIDGGSTEVTSVAGRVGAVVLTASDISGLSGVATSGNYSDLNGKPVIPTSLSQLTNNTSFITAAGAPVQSVAGKTGAIALTATDISGISTVGKTGEYADLLSKPTIPTLVSQLTNDASFVKADGSVSMTGEFIGAKKAGTSAAADTVASVHVRNNDGTGDTDLAAINFQCGVNYSTKLYLRSDGYFGIGGGSHNAWALYLDASSNLVAAGDITAYSDPRLKENIHAITFASDKISALGVYNFNWKYGIPHIANKAGEADVGLLANEVEELFPDFVNESIEIDGQYYKTVNYIKFIPILIQAFKEMKQELEDLKATVG